MRYSELLELAPGLGEFTRQIPEELDGGFCAALAGALTESGFLERCYPRRTYIPATEEALEALRDWAAEGGLHGL